jgi:acetyl esterase
MRVGVSRSRNGLAEPRVMWHKGAVPAETENPAATTGSAATPAAETSTPPSEPVFADAALAAFVQASRDDPGPTARSLGAEESRRAQRARVRAQPPGPSMDSVRDESAAGVPVRVYRARTDPAAASPGSVVFLHGGAWIIGSLDSHDRACRRLARATGLDVVAVGYRLAPENPWPAAVDDAVAAVRWTVRTTRPERLVIAGDSAGGTVATLACRRLLEAGERVPDLQVLLYPNTDLTLSQPSVRAFGTGFGLDVDFVRWGAQAWMPDPGRRADPGVSPLFLPDPAGSPPTLAVTNEADLLRDEGELYARRLAQAGVAVRHRRERGMIHGFLTLDTVSAAAAEAGERVFADIRDLLGLDGHEEGGSDGHWPGHTSRRRNASSTTRWARSGCPRARSGRPRRSARCRTSRSRECRWNPRTSALSD